MDFRTARGASGKIGAIAACACTYRRRPCLPANEQECTHSKVGGDTDALSRERTSQRPVSGRAECQFREARVHTDWLACSP